MEEVENTLKGFALDKSPGLDGWTMEFYLHFFNMLGMELVQAIGDSRISGVIPDKLNSTYLTLVPRLVEQYPLLTIGRLHYVTYYISLFLRLHL